MEEYGAKALDLYNVDIQKGEAVILPLDNTNIVPLPARLFFREKTIRRNGANWLATMDRSAGAGFYSVARGSLPFAIGPVQPQHFEVWIANQSCRYVKDAR